MLCSRYPLPFIGLLICYAVRTSGLTTTSLFIPVEYPLDSFSASVIGNDASATTFVFDCATDTSCGPVTVVQGPSTAIFTEADQPITTVWDCEFSPSTPTATCLVTSTSPGYSFPGTSTSFYPSESPDAFPTYLVDVTAGFVNAATTSLTIDTAAMSASIPAITSNLPAPPFRGSMEGSADATSSADSSTSSSTATGTITSMTGLPISSAVVTSVESSATNSEASSSGASMAPQKTGAASSSQSLTAKIKLLLFMVSVLFGM